MIPSDARPPGQDWLVKRLTDLERQVRELQAGRRLEAATIGKGGITVRGGTVRVTDDGSLVAEYANGALALYAGPMSLSDGTPVHAVQIRRPGGEPVLWTYGLDSGVSSFWAFYDKGGNIVMSDDAQSGQGVARPYVPLTVVPTTHHATRQQNTASSAFAAMWTVSGRKQHPRVEVYLMIQNDSGTSGEIRLRDPATGTVIAGPVATAAGAFTYVTLTGSIGGAHMAQIKFDVEMRLVAGAGLVGGSLIYAQGIQS